MSTGKVGETVAVKLIEKCENGEIRATMLGHCCHDTVVKPGLYDRGNCNLGCKYPARIVEVTQKDGDFVYHVATAQSIWNTDAGAPDVGDVVALKLLEKDDTFGFKCAMLDRGNRSCCVPLSQIDRGQRYTIGQVYPGKVLRVNHETGCCDVTLKESCLNPVATCATRIQAAHDRLAERLGVAWVL